jgi:hypothetical protein
MSEWIRAHRDELPPQRLTPALEHILAEGPGKLAAEARNPLFALDPSEATMFDAVERAMIAEWDARRGRVAVSLVAEVEPDVLPSHTLALFGAVLEPAPPRNSVERVDDARAPIEGTQNSDVLTVVPGTCAIELELEDKTMPWLGIDAVLENRLPRPVKLVALDLAVRDNLGGLLDCERRTLRDQFWHHGRLSARLAFTSGTFDRASAVDLMITHEVSFHNRVLVADLTPNDGTPLDTRTPWAYTLKPIEPGYPQFDARVAIFLPAAVYSRCRIVVELAQRTPLREASPVDVVFAMRNRGGSVVEQTTHKVTLENGGPTYVHAELNLTIQQLRTARRLEIGVAGTTRRTERVAAFTIP